MNGSHFLKQSGPKIYWQGGMALCDQHILIFKYYILIKS